MNKEGSKLLEQALKLKRKGKIKEAIKAYNDYLENHDVRDARVLFTLAELYTTLQDKENAISCLATVALQLKSDGFYSRAVAAIKQILSLDDSYISAYEELVDLYGELNQPDEQEKYQSKMNLLKAQAEAHTQEARAEKEKAQRAIAFEAVEAAIVKIQAGGDEEASKFLKELYDEIITATAPKRKKSKK